MEPFTIRHDGKTLKITSNLEYPIRIIEIILRYHVTVNMIDDKVGLKSITENIKIDKELKRNQTIEIQTKLEDISEVSIIYKDQMIVRRVDLSL
ncbi:hypothetical protein V6M85_00295 [Sulfolobus tengchongensis]|uniref:Uncharacterized protein n=1 Tax=Sulfolobus tengchongensis TaxID=207809 RepID=A0AAX4L063_9CREN